MRRAKEPGAWGLYEWVVFVLLSMCAGLLGTCAALMWSYFPVLAARGNSSTITKNESRMEAALSTLQEQQALSNATLDGILNELRDLNDKAGKAGNVTPPR